MKERIRQLAGKLEITSRPNRGALVTAKLPLSQSAASESGTVSDVSSAGIPIRLFRAPAGISRKQILIADDHEMLRRGLRTMLEKRENGKFAARRSTGETPSIRLRLSILTW